VTIAGPLTGTVGISYTFTITVSPVGATTPLSYTVKASDIATQTLVSSATVLQGGYTWVTPGAKTINVMVRNELGSVQASHVITLIETATVPKGVYLPLVKR
jgi:hypothetical protein